MVVNNSEKISNAQIQSPKNLSKRRRQSNWTSRPSEDFLNTRRKGAGIPKGTTLDERIMNQSRTLNSDEEQNKAANELRQGKNKGNQGEENQEEKGTDRQIKARARKEAREKKNQKEGADVSQGDMTTQGTAQLLKLAWLNLIDSFGLTLIYINLHVFGRSVMAGRVFCELGFEWLPPSMAKKMSSSPEVRAKMKKIALVEKMVLIFIDLAAIFIIISSLAFLILIVTILTSPVEMVKVFSGVAWNFVTLGIFK